MGQGREGLGRAGGLVPVIGSSPAEFAAFIKQDLAKYEKLVKTAGIRID